MERKELAIPPPCAMWIGLAVGFQAKPSVIPSLWRDDRCAPGNIGQADLEGNHSYKFIYSRVFAADPGGRNLLILLVGAVRFELTTPCAQGGGMANSFRSISPLGINVPRRKHLQSANWPVDDFVAAQNLTHPPASTTGRQEHYGNNTWTRGYGRLSVTAICTSSTTPPNARVFSGGADATRTQPYAKPHSSTSFNNRAPRALWK